MFSPPPPAFFAALLGTALAAQQEPHHLAHVTVPSAGALQRLVALDLDLAGCGHVAGDSRFPRAIEVIADPGDLATLRAAGFRAVITIPNLEAHYARQLAAAGPFVDLPNPPLGQGAMGGHWTWPQMVNILDDFALNHPGICTQKISLGQSIQGRDLWMVKISDNPGVDENEPEVLFDALHHAREPLSMETTIVFMEWLLTQYAIDPLATYLVNERELFFVPCVNPDGYEYNRQTSPGGGGLWRKNRRVNGGGAMGVDLNRNYDIGWNAPFGGNSSNPSSDTYRGTAPFSEPEVAAMVAFAAARSFQSVFTVHSYTDVLLEPYGYQSTSPTNLAAYNALGDQMTAANGIGHGPCFSFLYPLAGGALDHHHEVRGSYTWLPELGRANEGGFWPNPTQTVDIATRHQPMFRRMAITAGPWLELDGLSITEAAGSNGNGRVDPGETGDVLVALRNAGSLPTQNVTVTVFSATSGVQVTAPFSSPGILAPFSTWSSPTQALRVTVAPGFTGSTVSLAISVTGDGTTPKTFTETIPLAPLAPLVVDTFELDRGWSESALSTASTGRWSRGAPQATTSGGVTIQPGTQTTPMGQLCWVTDPLAGTSAGNRDVDGGFTDLLSPVMDLAGLDAAEVSFQRWYGESAADDPFLAYASLDGGATWIELLRDAQPTPGWVLETLALPGPLTAQVQVRLRAQDLNPSLVEAAIDDVNLEAVGTPGAVVALGSGARQSTLSVGMLGSPNSVGFLLASNAVSPSSTTFPGVQGAFQLALPGVFYLPSVFFGANQLGAQVDIPIPNDPGLVGASFFLQGVHAAGGAGPVGFGNVVTVTLQ